MPRHPRSIYAANKFALVGSIRGYRRLRLQKTSVMREYSGIAGLHVLKTLQHRYGLRSHCLDWGSLFYIDFQEDGLSELTG